MSDTENSPVIEYTFAEKVFRVIMLTLLGIVSLVLVGTMTFLFYGAMGQLTPAQKDDILLIIYVY